MQRFLKLKRVGDDEKGFTLIELLIVIAILSILAALIILSVLVFLESGKVGTGRAERSTLQAGVDGAMADGGCGTLAGEVTGWHGEAAQVVCGSYDAHDYLRRTPTDGTFTVSTEGQVICTAYPGLSGAGVARINE